MNTNDRAFAHWMKLVDKHVLRLSGVLTSDLPDMDYWTMHDDGLVPVEAARVAIAELLN